MCLSRRTFEGGGAGHAEVGEATARQRQGSTARRVSAAGRRGYGPPARRCEHRAARLHAKHEAREGEGVLGCTVEPAVHSLPHGRMVGIKQPEARAVVGGICKRHHGGELVGSVADVGLHRVGHDGQQRHPRKVQRKQPEGPLLYPRVTEALRGEDRRSVRAARWLGAAAARVSERCGERRARRIG